MAYTQELSQEASYTPLRSFWAMNAPDPTTGISNNYILYFQLKKGIDNKLLIVLTIIF
ncbi:MAG: hypothetical protein U5J82_12625 [Desulfobacterales bacterium]|nr:hypothetical protein [Desulfobacterales bacterium]